MSFLELHAPLMLVFLLSIVIGLLMVVVFRYTSDQKAIRVAKDHLKAHLLAVQLFQDQLQVVLVSYWRIIRSTGNYLRLAFVPVLYVSIPLIFLMMQVDRYLGYSPIAIGQSFLVKARLVDSNALDQASLRLPSGLSLTAPAVHVPAANEIVWRVIPQEPGKRDLQIDVGSDSLLKSLEVSGGIKRISPTRLKDKWRERTFVSGEDALPSDSPVQSISINYPERTIAFAWLEWNWIWLFFVLSLIFGFLFKTILRIEI
jgi:hypothetical protein